MWILLIPAAVIVGAWIYGATKVNQPRFDSGNSPTPAPLPSQSPPPFVPGVFDAPPANTPLTLPAAPAKQQSIAIGDTVVVDMSKAANLPVPAIGTIPMFVMALDVDGDTSFLLCSFIPVEMQVLGFQAVARSAVLSVNKAAA